MKNIKTSILILFAVFFLAVSGSSYGSQTADVLTDYTDSGSGFSFQYPDYWTVERDVEDMLQTIDGSIDLIHEENLTESERAGYKVLVHVDGTPRYLSNIAVIVHPHRTANYASSEEASQAVKTSFERTMASGTFFLEETYLGESHTFVYRRNVPLSQWNDNIRITYYITASTTHAYLLMETILVGTMDDVYTDQFNQVIQLFRVTANELSMIDPSLDWGAFKPGETPEEETGTDVGEVDFTENFDNNRLDWPTGDNAEVQDGRYGLDSRSGYPFTVTNTGMGQITFDFSLEGKPVFLDGDESAGYGLVYAYRDPDNYFAFLVNRSGLYILVEEKNGVVNQLIPWTPCPLLTGDSHVLMVQGNYNTVTVPQLMHRYEFVLYVDGQEINRILEDDILDVSGWFGIFVSEELNVAFDYLTSRNYLVGGIWSLDRFEY